MTLRASSTAPHGVGDPPTSGSDGAVTLIDLQRLWIRHQALAPFRLEYDGRRPMVIFLFSAARPASGGPALKRGAFRLLMPGQPLTLESVEPTETLAIAFDSPKASSGAARPGPAPVRGADAGVRALAHEIRRVLLTEGDQARGYLSNLADALVTRALLVSEAQAVGGRRPDLTPFTLRRVQEQIDSRLAERVTVEELAAVAGLSRSYFSRAFHAATGESPHQFILARRLAEARRRLDDSAADLAVIAIQTGFSSHAHLTTAFGQAFGLTPQAYRRRQAAGQRLSLAPPGSIRSGTAVDD